MVWHFTAANSRLGATVVLICPHCGFRQLRARRGVDEAYLCKQCHAAFTRAQAESEAQAAEARRAARRAKR